MTPLATIAATSEWSAVIWVRTPLAQQVGARVPDVPERQLAVLDHDTGDRRPKLAAIGGGVDSRRGLLDQRDRVQRGGVGGRLRLGPDTGDTAAEARCPATLRITALTARAAGDLAGLHAAHPVGDAEQGPVLASPVAPATIQVA